MLIVRAEGLSDVRSLLGETKAIERFQPDIHVSVLQEFVIEIFLRELRIESQQAVKLFAGIVVSAFAKVLVSLLYVNFEVISFAF